MNSKDRHTLLVVDDLADNLELIRQMFEDDPYDIITADSAETAASLVEDRRPDLAILDVHMPNTDGFELCHYLREKFTSRPVPIIFLTAVCTTTENTVHGLNIGACDYMAKPVDSEVLRAKVHAILRSETEQQEQCDRARKVVRRLMKR